MNNKEIALELFDTITKCIEELPEYDSQQALHDYIMSNSTGSSRVKMLCVSLFGVVRSSSNKEDAIDGIEYLVDSAQKTKLNVDDIMLAVDKLYDSAMADPSTSKEKSSPEAPDGALLDRYAFADHRVGVPREADNKFEKELYDSIRNFFAMNAKIGDKHGKAMKEFLEKNQYSKVFRSPTGEMKLLRGMVLTKEALTKFLGKEVGENGSYENCIFTPKQGAYVSSWTTETKIAEIYSALFNKAQPYGVVLTAYATDNPNCFVACPNGLYKVKGFDQFSGEQEYLGLGEIKVARVEWKYLL